MNFPFIKVKDKDKVKEQMLKGIRDEGIRIAKLMVTFRAQIEDIEHLEALYKEYYDAYPNPDKWNEQQLKFVKLKAFVKA